jgi:hypothetical protein
MTVKELMKELKKYPEGMKVVVYSYDESCGVIVQVKTRIKSIEHREFGVEVGERYLDLDSILDEY